MTKPTRFSFTGRLGCLFLTGLAVISGACSNGAGAGNNGSGGMPGAAMGGGGMATGGVSMGDAATGGAATGGGGAGGGATGGGGAGGGATGGSGPGGMDGGGGDTGGDTGGKGGSAGGGGASPNDGGAPDGDGIPFLPCPATGDCKIMPLGDSITDGFGIGGYRVELFRRALMDAKRVTLVGSVLSGPNSVSVNGMTVTFPRAHEGHSSFTIDPSSRLGLSTVTDAALTTYRPHIVLLMIGTNDVDLDLDLVNAPMRLGALMDRITANSPNALLVVAKMVPSRLDVNNVRTQVYNDAIPALLQTRVAGGKHIIMVDMYAAFTANADYKNALLTDNLHPNAAGYAVMSQVWYAAIKAVLP